MMQLIANDNATTQALRLTYDAAQALHFLGVPAADRVTIYWPLALDAQARAVLQDVKAHPTVTTDHPATSTTRPTFGAARVACALLTFAAHARLVAAGYADPIPRA